MKYFTFFLAIQYNMPLFKTVKPMVTYRVYLSLGVDDAEIANANGCLWDDKLKLWYLNEDKYRESGIEQNSVLKQNLKPFKAYGIHQHFL